MGEQQTVIDNDTEVCRSFPFQILRRVLGPTPKKLTAQRVPTGSNRSAAVFNGVTAGAVRCWQCFQVQLQRVVARLRVSEERAGLAASTPRGHRMLRQGLLDV